MRRSYALFGVVDDFIVVIQKQAFDKSSKFANVSNRKCQQGVKGEVKFNCRWTLPVPSNRGVDLWRYDLRRFTIEKFRPRPWRALYLGMNPRADPRGGCRSRGCSCFVLPTHIAQQDSEPRAGSRQGQNLGCAKSCARLRITIKMPPSSNR